MGESRYLIDCDVAESAPDSTYVVSELSAIASPPVAAPPTFDHEPLEAEDAPGSVETSPDEGTRTSVVTVVVRLFESVTTHCNT
jgi:hypothetical protein